MSCASNAGFAARCYAGISATLMGWNQRRIASAGSCRLVTQSSRQPIRSGVRQWQSRSASEERGKPSCRRRLPKRWRRWFRKSSPRPRRGVAANHDRQPRSSSNSATPAARGPRLSTPAPHGPETSAGRQSSRSDRKGLYSRAARQRLGTALVRPREIAEELRRRHPFQTLATSTRAPARPAPAVNPANHRIRAGLRRLLQTLQTGRSIVSI